MIGAIAGDIIGSVYERQPIKTLEFPLFSNYSTFTDDTVLTIATAFSILHSIDYATSYRKFGKKYPDAGYGMSFYKWIYSSEGPYNSWGNGSAMRVSPVGYAYNSIRDVLSEAEKCASVTHNHPEGIKGAQATALSIFLSVKGESKKSINKEISERFGYNLDRKLDEIRPEYSFDVSCQGSVPESIVAFLESENVEDSIRKGISLGGDSDTMACIAGGISQAFYNKIPEEILTSVRKRLPDEFLEIIDEFNTKFRVQF